MIRAELQLIERWVGGIDPPILDLGSSTADFRARPKLPYDLGTILGVRVLSVDAKAAAGVDIVADAHQLTSAIPADSVNAVICTSLFEHVRRPWIVVRQIASVLRPGGTCVLSAPWVYPEHRDPIDCYRFSVDGLRALAAEAGLVELDAGTLRESIAVISYWVGIKPCPAAERQT